MLPNMPPLPVVGVLCGWYGSRNNNYAYGEHMGLLGDRQGSMHR
jgi:hypothetical protein